jgi:hypothetical protein
MLRFRSWIQHQKLYDYDLCKNPNYIQMLDKNPELINWSSIGMNPAAIHIIERHLDKITFWYTLSANPKAIHIMNNIIPVE